VRDKKTPRPTDSLPDIHSEGLLLRQLALMMRGQPDLGKRPALGEDQVVERHANCDEADRGLLGVVLCRGFRDPRDASSLGAVSKVIAM
jgi:hypothetical protein